MLLWTVQPQSAWTDIRKTGVFRCQREKSFNLTKPDSLEKPYRWLMDRMREKIGPAPAGVDYPVWAWHTWEFERRAPDPNSAAFVKRTEAKVLLRLAVPAFQAVLTDFDAWQLLLQNAYVADAKTEEEYIRLEAWMEGLAPETLARETEASWDRVFLIDPVDSEWLTRGKYVQATFWEIRREYVKKAEELPALE